MKAAFVILIAIIIVGALAWLIDKLFFNKVMGTPDAPATPPEEDKECCGMHINCPKDTLSPVSPDIEYYDDEELDRFAGRAPQDYTPEEIEEFQDILLTLLPEDVPGWARSIQLRNIELPIPVRDALLMIVADQRHKK